MFSRNRDAAASGRIDKTGAAIIAKQIWLNARDQREQVQHQHAELAALTDKLRVVRNLLEDLEGGYRLCKSGCSQGGQKDRTSTSL